MNNWDILTYSQIFDIKNIYICVYECGIKWVQNWNICPKWFYTLYLNGEVINYNPLEIIINTIDYKHLPMIVLSWKRKNTTFKNKWLYFTIKKILVNKSK
jgi:hypothetical protein